jgi:hypothetical protein
MGSGDEKSIERIAQALNRAIETHVDYNVTLLLENTAGQGTSVGWRFEHLGEIISMVDRPERMGICLDTSHAFAAGYELRTPEGYENTWEVFNRHIGLEKIKAFHLNDSKKDFGSRVDRHEHIGHGYLGKKPFEYILNDKRFDGLAGCLETPKEGDWDKENLLTLRRLEQMPVAKKKTGGCGAKKATPTAKKKVTAKKPAAKKRIAKKVVKKVTAKKPAAKKTAAKKTVKKVAPKKPAAKKPAAKKVVKKKPAAKKPAAKKVVKKVAPKKTAARKPAARKKATPKKATTRSVARKK